MSQAAAQQPSRKKTVISLLVLLALTCIIVFTFKVPLGRDHCGAGAAFGVAGAGGAGGRHQATPCWRGAWRGSSCAAACRSSNCGKG